MAASQESQDDEIATAMPACARVTSDSRIYAIGDIHGRADLLESMLARLTAESAGFAGRRVVVFLGDYVDRGAYSRQVLELLAAGPPAESGFEWVCLRGNHEAMMLDFLDDPAGGPVWLMNGGLATANSYLGPMPHRSAIDHAALEELRSGLVRSLPQSHLAFLQGLKLLHREGDYCFVHAGLRPGVPSDRQRAEDMLWIRRDFLTSQADFGCVVVHGHSISGRPDVRPNRIGIDTGAYKSGRLTALALEGDKRWFLST